MYQIYPATAGQAEDILALYKMQIGREFCPWDAHYPTENEIAFDLSRNALFVMVNNANQIIATVSIDEDEAVNALPCWTPSLQPGGELARLAVHPDYQNQGIARQMLAYGMKMLAKRGFKSIHFLVNKHNKKALRSYAAFQFPVVGECELFDQPFYCYEKAL